ncbi:hypothetical protein N825_33560 [Skermanella stibiiresistens SB22]|uniref:BioF2-like acetyltransferase domain-containing protein n=1 Tax=Skermanella stibiiresistens SB22 TaxID=1385369 RepID=W9H3T9_9PROT|nr:GNAT family N-acetyltransferase [Skermanella stibiiresistens]EWY40860.1 hypothetical protein N825_33560 [Skermanella stibiiresistens SB22]
MRDDIGLFCPPSLGTTDIRVEVVDVDEFAQAGDAWRDLVSRTAVPNVFMEPAVVLALDRSTGIDIRVLMAWHVTAGDMGGDKPPRLLGVWVVTVGRSPSGLPIRILKSPISKYAYFGAPVVDTEYASAVFTALFDRIALDPKLPKLLLAGDMMDEGPLADALRGALAARGSRAVVIERRKRAKLQSDLTGSSYLGRSLSGNRRRRYQQLRKRLALMGAVTTTSHRSSNEVRSAFEDFLLLEASGWKGKRRSAILNDAKSTAFARAMIADLAEADLVAIHALRLDGRAIAMSVELRSGAACFAWRISFDESLRQFAPGILLLHEVTVALLDDRSIVVTDSCNHRDVGFVADCWAERLSIVDLLIDTRPARAAMIETVGGAERLRRRARENAKSLYKAAKRWGASVYKGHARGS